MNYAAIGFVVGHEITHGFDDRVRKYLFRLGYIDKKYKLQGRQFDADGNLVEWWDEETIVQFEKKAKCIIEQYGNYTDEQTMLNVNNLIYDVEEVVQTIYFSLMVSTVKEKILPIMAVFYKPIQLIRSGFQRTDKSLVFLVWTTVLINYFGYQQSNLGVRFIELVTFYWNPIIS